MQPDVNWKRQLWKKFIWFDLGVLANFLYYVSGRDSEAIEKIYSRSIFVGIRYIWDYTVGLIPIPLVFIFLVLFIFWITRKIYLKRKRGIELLRVSWKRKIFNLLMTVLALAGAVVFFFYFLWGFNYNRVAIETQLNLEVIPLEGVLLQTETELALRMAKESRKLIPGATIDSLEPSVLPADLESEMRHNLSEVLRNMGYPAPGRVRIRNIWPGDILMRFRVSGIYIPFFGEGYTSKNLTSSEKPFTLAHEMAHGLGFADEGSANFLAYLACESSENAAVIYSGRLAYWSYIAGEYAMIFPDDYGALFQKMSLGIKADLRAIAQNWSKYRGTLARIGEKVNDQYLKSQGVKEGIKSYNRMVVLVSAWRKEKDTIEIPKTQDNN